MTYDFHGKGICLERDRVGRPVVVTEPNRGTVAPFLLNANLAALEKLGVDGQAVCEHMGMSRSGLAALETPVAYPLLERLWDGAVVVSRDPLIGLRAAELLRAEHLDLIGYAARHSPSLREAAQCLVRYSGLLSSRHRVTLEEEADEAVLALDYPGGDPVHRQVAEASLRMVAAVASQLCGQSLRARAVLFTHPAPDDATLHRQVFGPNIRFNAPRNALVFAAAYLDYPVLGHDARLCQILERQARDLMVDRPQNPSLSERVRRTLVQGMVDQNTSAEHVADQLHMSVRSLSRHLRAESTSHQALLDQVRYELAARYLSRTGAEVGDVAFRLGFADASSFNRAFRRWSGRTPSDFREG